MPPPAPPKKEAPAAPSFQEGDKVIVTSGDLKNLMGTVTNALSLSKTVLVKPQDKHIDGALPIAVIRLCKFFEVGDYVNVVSGDHKGDAGHVEFVNLGPKNEWGPHATAQILTSSYTSFEANLNDLRRGYEQPVTFENIGEFRVGQLVMVAGCSESRAMIARLEAGSRAFLLSQDGTKIFADVAELRPVELPKKSVYKRQVWCEDRAKQRIVPGATVKAPQTLSGRATPISAEVLYIHQNTVFLRALEGLVGEKAYMVAPGDKCEFFWNKDDVPQKRGGQVMRMPEPEPKQMSYGITMASKTSFLRPNFYKQLGLAAPRPGQGGPGTVSKGAGVRITGGKYKGYRGEIRDLLGDRARISLLSQSKLVEVSMEHISEDVYLQDKSTRWPGAQPKTPWAQTMPAPPLEGHFLPDQIMDANIPSNDDAWDANWLMGGHSEGERTPVSPKPASVHSLLGNGERMSPAGTPQPPSVTHSVASSRKRKPRLPAHLLG